MAVYLLVEETLNTGPVSIFFGALASKTSGFTLKQSTAPESNLAVEKSPESLMDLLLNATLANHEETLHLGYIMGQIYLEGPRVWSLNGEMGSGKTTFTQGVARGLGLQEQITSPTFNLVNEYLLPSTHTLYHFDWYRLVSPEDLFVLGFEEYLEQPKALIIIEWGNLFPEYLPRHCLHAHFKHHPQARQVEIQIPSKFKAFHNILKEKLSLDHVHP